MIYLCEACGIWRPHSLAGVSMWQAFAIALDKEPLIIRCPSGHGPMREVTENDRLVVLPATVEAEQETPTHKPKVEYREPSQLLQHSIDIYFHNRYGIPTSPDDPQPPLLGPNDTEHLEH